MGAAFGRIEVGHDIDLVPEHQGDQRVAHLPVANQMRERVDAGFRQRDGVVVVEDVRRGLEPVLVRFVDGRARQRDRKTRRPAAAVVHPNLDDVDLPGRLLLHGAPDVLFGRHRIGEVCVERITGPAPGAPMPRPASSSCAPPARPSA